jgi:nucleoside phosphorylase/CheY-like chemotaxis protein
MLDVLIIDDNVRKVEKISAVIREFPEISTYKICVAKSQIEGKQVLREKQFDLVILDIQLPVRAGETPLADGGVNLLQEIHARTLYHKPMCIVGLTAYPELLAGATTAFAESMWSIVLYDDTSREWANRLIYKIRYLLEVKARKVSANTFKRNLGIITALNTPEFEAVLRLTQWKRCDGGKDSTIYMEGLFSEATKDLAVVAACAPQMGMPAAAVLATKMMMTFTPQYLALVGITAGVAGKTCLGDFVIADPCWDWGGGKYKVTEGGSVFEPDPMPYRLEPHVKALFQDVQLDRDLLNAVWSGWSGRRPVTAPHLHIGPCASGASVVADEARVAMIQQYSRKLIGVDMEAYGVMHAAFHAPEPTSSAFSLKVVSDYADAEKSDHWQEYAAYASASLLRRIALKYF